MNNTNEKAMQSVVKLFVQKSTPNYCMPWQMKRQYQSCGSGFVLSNRRILTNAHVVAYEKSVRITRHGDAKKYNARVLHVAHECDLAVVGVDDESFWDGLEALELGDISTLEEDVVVIGFPTGGKNICVTRGVVSRVDVHRYSHSGINLLAIQIDAAINPGNSGGPAFKDGKVVGVAFEALQNAENIGYIIPVTVIKHFFADTERSKKFSGFCDLGIHWQPIESDHMRKYFQLCTKETGVLIARVLRMSCSNGKLQRGDVLMAVDNVEIADDGTVPFRGKERIRWSYMLDSKFLHDDVVVTLKRAGKKLDVTIKLRVSPTLVPMDLYDRRPSYVVYCGLVFIALSQPYLSHQYGKDWLRKAPVRLCNRLLHNYQQKPEQEVILLSQVLASEITAGYENFSNLQLYKLNGIPILNLKHLCYLLDQLTLPHLDQNNMDYSSKNDEVKKEEAGSSDIHTSLSGDNMIDSGQTTGDNIGGEEIATNISNDLDEYVSFNAIDKENGDCEKESDIRSNDGLEGETGLLDCTTFTDWTIDSPNLFDNSNDEPLLLDCKNFIHFELDKDRVVVFNISEAYTKSKEILNQYAITFPRSENLPKQSF